MCFFIQYHLEPTHFHPLLIIIQYGIICSKNQIFSQQGLHVPLPCMTQIIKMYIQINEYCKTIAFHLVVHVGHKRFYIYSIFHKRILLVEIVNTDIRVISSDSYLYFVYRTFVQTRKTVKLIQNALYRIEILVSMFKWLI